MNQILWQKEWWRVCYTLSSSQVYIFKACNLGLHPSECPNWICSDILFSCCEDWQRNSRSLSQGEREYHSRFCWVFFPHSSLSLKKTKRNLLYGLGEYCCSSLATVARAWNLFCFCSLRYLTAVWGGGKDQHCSQANNTILLSWAGGCNGSEPTQAPWPGPGHPAATFHSSCKVYQDAMNSHFPFPFSCPLCTLLEAVISMHD